MFKKPRVSSDAVWLDVRQPEEFSQGTVSGALNIPHDQMLSRLSEIEADDDQMICVFCMGGKRAASAKQILEQDGYNNVVNLGGIQDALAARK